MDTNCIGVFFAIPCGDYYSNQKSIIKRICSLYGVRSIINEADYTTASLLGQICRQIEKCDYFVADISSNSPNIILELGYALKAKKIEDIGVLLSNVANCPSDLQDIKRLQYGNYNQFADKLNSWLSNILSVEIKIVDESFSKFNYYDSFQDIDSFLTKWQIPLGCDYSLTINGLRFSNAHRPIISKHLAYLDKYTFEFDCQINNQVIGWIVKGTQSDVITKTMDFCVMFNLNIDGYIHPHIFSINKPNELSLYQPFDRVKVPIDPDLLKTRINIKTHVDDYRVKVQINDIDCLEIDFSNERYRDYYDSITEKTNQVGFRCDFLEEATIFNVRIHQK